MQDAERPKFLVELLAEVDAFDAELFKPTFPVSKDTEDKVVGTLSPWLRKLYSLGRYYARQAKLIAVEKEFESVEEVAGNEEIVSMTYRQDVLNTILWAAIRAEYGVMNADSVGLRVDWQVVTSKKPDNEEEQFARFLGNMMRRRK